MLKLIDIQHLHLLNTTIYTIECDKCSRKIYVNGERDKVFCITCGTSTPREELFKEYLMKDK